MIGRPGHSKQDVEPSLGPEEMAALEKELEGLSRLEVPAAARERGWALVRDEIQEQQARGGFQRQAQRRGWGGWRVALAGGFAVIALVLAGLGVHSLSLAPVANNGQAGSTEIASVPTAGSATGTAQTPSSGPRTTLTPGGATGSTGGTSVTSSVSGSNPATGETTQSTSGTGQAPTTRRPSTSVTAAPSTTGQTTVTTVNTSTTRQYLTKEERASSAAELVNLLAQAVVSQDRVSAQGYVDGSARSGLAYLMASLQSPTASAVSILSNVEGEDVRVALDFTDNQVDGQGVSKTVEMSFHIVVRVNEGEPRIVGIYQAP